MANEIAEEFVQTESPALVRLIGNDLVEREVFNLVATVNFMQAVLLHEFYSVYKYTGRLPE